jgi:ribose 5-phosphate isomerase A
VIDPADRAKAAAAEAGVRLVHVGQRVALGTGSTAAHAIRALAKRFPAEGRIETVASSEGSARMARELGLTVSVLRGNDRFDIMLDGADEVAPDLSLTKGGGGALFREKVLARLSREVVILVDSSKLVERLGRKFRIPVEVVPFARPVIAQRLTDEGADPRLRMAPGGGRYVTDNGNNLLDVAWPDGVADPGETERHLASIPGVVESGLFVGLATLVQVGHEDGSVEVRLPNTPRAIRGSR